MAKKLPIRKICTYLVIQYFRKQPGYLLALQPYEGLFGFLTTNSNPSRASLDILSQYCGFTDWSDFITKTGDEQPTGNDIVDFWQAAQAKAHTLSKKYCETIKKQVPINFSNTVIRAFAEERLTYFLKSEYVATPFVGPGGYGKSTLLAGWVTKYMAQTCNHNDIILFIPAATLENTAHIALFEAGYWHCLALTPAQFFECIGESFMPYWKIHPCIDALDELTDVGTKSNKIFTVCTSSLSRFHRKAAHKSHVSQRYATWRISLTKAPRMRLVFCDETI